jgi:ketosteroid isomerase-like protein
MTDPTEPDREAVLAAASEIVDAFAATDGDRYFAAFAPEATFLFHTEPERLADRAAYERLWAGWVDGGWRVLSCTSSDPLVQTFPGGAVFTHSVETSVDTGEGSESYRERESIVFRVEGAADASSPRLVAVHEHLSPMPDAADAS